MLSAAFRLDLILVYFIYGLAFFSLGLVMMLEWGRSPLLAEGRVLRPLAVFGFVHGTHEWLELALLLRQGLRLPDSSRADLARLILLAFSFFCLLVFGLRVLQPHQRLTRRLVAAWLGGLSLYAVLVFLLIWSLGGRQPGWERNADVLTRYLLAVPAGFLAGLALVQQARQARREGRPSLSASLYLAAFGFSLYALTQLFVPPAAFFPADRLNTAAFLAVFGFPIQGVRSVLAVLITVGLIRATQAVDAERQRLLSDAQQAQLAALEQVQRELTARESLRRELLRHTVVAQEDERARIARELHDESAQVLTAFSLHLASFRDALSDQPAHIGRVDRLLAITRQLSEGIYRLVHDLRPAQLDDLGLVPALQWMMDEERKRTGLEVSLRIDGPRRRLDPLVETVLFRVAQEGLANVDRHAQVKQAQMELSFDVDEAVLRVCDQGAGFDSQARLIPPRGWGLMGMTERVESVGGALHIISSPGHGTLVEARVPVAVEER